MHIITYFFLLLIILFGVVFAILNPDIVTIHYYFKSTTLPLSLLLVIMFSIGCILGLLLGGWLLLKAKVRYYFLQKKLRLVEKEINNLRAIPLQDDH